MHVSQHGVGRVRARVGLTEHEVDGLQHAQVAVFAFGGAGRATASEHQLDVQHGRVRSLDRRFGLSLEHRALDQHAGIGLLRFG